MVNGAPEAVSQARDVLLKEPRESAPREVRKDCKRSVPARAEYVTPEKVIVVSPVSNMGKPRPQMT